MTRLICEFTQNECSFYWIILLQETWLFNSATHQKEIHLMLIFGNNKAASTSTQITKVTQLISCMSSICINNPAYPCLTERSSWWIDMITTCIPCCKTAGISLSRKCDVTERRSQPWIVTCRHLVLVGSFVSSLALYLAQSHLIVLDVNLNFLVWISELYA